MFYEKISAQNNLAYISIFSLSSTEMMPGCFIFSRTDQKVFLGSDILLKQCVWKATNTRYGVFYKCNALGINFKNHNLLGTDCVTKTDEFSEHFQRVGRGGSEVPSLKCVLFWFFSIQLLKNIPWNDPFVSISCSKSPVWRSKICNINFWIGNDPPFGTFPKIHPFWSGRPSLS